MHLYTQVTTPNTRFQNGIVAAGMGEKGPRKPFYLIPPRNSPMHGCMNRERERDRD